MRDFCSPRVIYGPVTPRPASLRRELASRVTSRFNITAGYAPASATVRCNCGSIGSPFSFTRIDHAAARSSRCRRSGRSRTITLKSEAERRPARPGRGRSFLSSLSLHRDNWTRTLRASGLRHNIAKRRLEKPVHRADATRRSRAIPSGHLLGVSVLFPVLFSVSIENRDRVSYEQTLLAIEPSCEGIGAACISHWRTPSPRNWIAAGAEGRSFANPRNPIEPSRSRRRLSAGERNNLLRGRKHGGPGANLSEERRNPITEDRGGA